MKKITLKTNAKVNFTLDVIGEKDGFHQLESLVASIGIYDRITLVKRLDQKVTLTVKGNAGCSMENNNAYKAAVAFINEFNTTGVDIYLEKNIPLGGGLGGSSADIAGVLNGMKRLYKIDADMSLIAQRLGSDTVFMLNGGWAVIKGRGEQVIPIKRCKPLHLLLLTCDKSCSAGECYKEYDAQNKTYAPKTGCAVDCIEKGDVDGFMQTLKNDLYGSAIKLVPQIEKNLELMKGVGYAVMTGSGSVVFGVYPNKKQLNKAYQTLSKVCKNNLIKTKTF